MEDTLTLKEQGIKKGYLQNKEVWLKPITDRTKTLITKDPRNSIHAFMYEGAKLEWVVPMNERLDLIDPFNGNEDERLFFEKMLGLNLKTTKTPDCYWLRAKVSVTKETSVMQLGVRFDMSNPEDVIRVKILRMQREIAPSWDEREIPHYRWVLVDKDVVDNSKKKETDKTVRVWTHFGSIAENKEKLSEFLELYIMNTKKFMEVPANPTESYLRGEVTKIAEEEKDTYLSIVNDPHKEMKALVLKGIKCGAVYKNGVNSYSEPGNTIKYSLDEFVARLEKAKETSDDVYLKLVAQVEMDTKPAKKAKV